MEKRVRLNTTSSLYNERPDLFQAAAHGIRDVLHLQGYVPALSSGGINTALVLDEFERRFYNVERKQLALRPYIENLAQATDVAGSTADYILTDQDIYADGTNFVFGSTIPEWQLSVQSVARFIRNTSDQRVQKKVITHIARHEYAHLAGLNMADDYDHPDQRGGIYEGHCANICTMRQVMNTGEAVTLTQQLEDHELAGFCTGCVASLRRKATLG